MSKKTIFIFLLALVLIILFFVFILIPRDFSIPGVQKEVDSRIENRDVVRKSLDIDFTTVNLQERETRETSDGIVKLYQITGKDFQKDIELAEYLDIEISSDNKMLVMGTENSEFAMTLYDIAIDKFENKVKLETKEDIEKSQSNYFWSPDSKYISFVKSDGMSQELYIYDVVKDIYNKALINSLVVCGDSCYSETPFWSPDSSYVAIVEHTRDEVGEYSDTFVSVFDTNGNRIEKSETIFIGDTTTLFRLDWDEEENILYSYSVETEEEEKLVSNQKVILEYSKLK